MRRRHIAIAAACVAMVIAGSLAIRHGAQSKQASLDSLCEIVSKPKEFAGKSVSFHAAFVTDGLEHSVLYSKDCERGITPFVPESRQAQPDIRAFNSLLNSIQKTGRLETEITGTFSGRVEIGSDLVRLDIANASGLSVQPSTFFK